MKLDMVHQMIVANTHVVQAILVVKEREIVIMTQIAVDHLFVELIIVELDMI